MSLKSLCSCFVLFVYQFVLAQPAIFLKQVVVADTQLKNFSNSKSIFQLNDSIISKNQSSLTSVLNYNSTIYFKENGLGMVSSPSFRGTTAQQTAVIWNGININSQLNGQTDFNIINAKNFNNIVVRGGGGSAIYGSSAIGGSIHLNNNFEFSNKIVNTLDLNYGSFNSFNSSYKFDMSTNKIAIQIGVFRNSSDNDYEYLGTDKKNENGSFFNTNLIANFGYKIRNNTIKIYSSVVDSQRHFSGTLAAPSKSKYLDFNTRNLVEWGFNYNSIISKIKVAFLTEGYKYFEDKDELFFSFSKAETFIVKHDLVYNLNSKIQLNSIIELSQTKGFGTDLNENKRQVESAVILIKHQVFRKLLYEISMRKELTNTYKSPVLFSIGTKYTVNNNYNLKANFSRNFRIPSFNDLYWSIGGNVNLKPESAYQSEIGQEVILKNIRFTSTFFYNNIDDFIQWQPNNSGFWQPNNTKKVKTYGFETSFEFNKKLHNHHLNCNVNYAYTISKNDEDNFQLIYVPVHKFTSTISYSYKKISLFAQLLFNGKVFTSTDNFYILKEYAVTNLGLNYNFGAKKNYQIGLTIFNFLNKNYQNVLMRPMPGRNFNINLIFKL